EGVRHRVRRRAVCPHRRGGDEVHLLRPGPPHRACYRSRPWKAIMTTTTAAPVPAPTVDWDGIIDAMSDAFHGESLARFVRDAAGLEFTVLHDEGLWRHLRYRAPRPGLYWFDIITSPGLLTFNGDTGTFVFSRLPDMLEFFTGQYINPGYWG